MTITMGMIEVMLQARAKMILSQGEEEASRRLVDAGNSLKK